MNTGGPSRIPVRGSFAAVLTMGGLALLLGVRTTSAPTAQGSFTVGGTDEAGGGGQATLAPEAAVASPAETAIVTAGPTAATSLTAPSTATTRSATGDAIDFRFGTVQVEVTVEDGQLVDVQALQLPDGDRHSASISDQVEPWLREMALAACDADIDIVSGATYTSEAYAESLQSALDQLVG